MSLSIRAVRQDDKGTWLNLWRQYNQFYNRTISQETTDKAFSRFIDDDIRMYCAVAEIIDQEKAKSSANDIVGFIHWYPHVTTAAINEQVYIHDLYVNPAVRNKGTGRALIEHVYGYAKSLPASSVYWHTQHFNHAAQILYTKIANRTDFVVYRKPM